MTNSYYVNRFHAYSPNVDLTKDQLADKLAKTIPNTDQLTYPNGVDTEIVLQAGPENANLITSFSKSNILASLGNPESRHAPVIDIDVPCELLPSSQVGHYHLYINKEITWINYKRILQALASAGIVEPGYRDVTIKNKFSAVRPIGVTKPGLKVTTSSIIKNNARLRRSLYLTESQSELKNKKITALITKLSEFIDESEIAQLLKESGPNFTVQPEPVTVGSSSSDF